MFKALGGRPKAPATAGGERIYAIGDIHGRLDLLQLLLKKLERDTEVRRRLPTRLVLLGDVIDRGPQSRHLIEMLQRIQRSTDRVIVLCGNHEEMLLHAAGGNGTAQAVWVENGGGATLESYGIDLRSFLEQSAKERAQVIRKALGEETLRWLRNLPTSYRSGDFFFCHAGIRPGEPLAAQKRGDLLWIREEFLASKNTHEAVVVHGHTECMQVEVLRNRINLDTAAYRTDVLSALGLQGTSMWFLSTAPS